MIAADSDSCAVCKIGFDVYNLGGGGTVDYCANCQINNLERDTVRCNLDSSGNFVSPKGCLDGYVSTRDSSGTLYSPALTRC